MILISADLRSAVNLILYCNWSTHFAGSILVIVMVSYFDIKNIIEISCKTCDLEFSCCCIETIRTSSWGNIKLSSIVIEFKLFSWAIVVIGIWTGCCKYRKWSCSCCYCLSIWRAYCYCWRALRNLNTKYFWNGKSIRKWAK